MRKQSNIVPSAYSQFVFDAIKTTENIVALAMALSIEMVAHAYQAKTMMPWKRTYT